MTNKIDTTIFSQFNILEFKNNFYYNNTTNLFKTMINFGITSKFNCDCFDYMIEKSLNDNFDYLILYNFKQIESYIYSSYNFTNFCSYFVKFNKEIIFKLKFFDKLNQYALNIEELFKNNKMKNDIIEFYFTEKLYYYQSYNRILVKIHDLTNFKMTNDILNDILVKNLFAITYLYKEEDYNVYYSNLNLLIEKFIETLSTEIIYLFARMHFYTNMLYKKNFGTIENLKLFISENNIDTSQFSFYCKFINNILTPNNRITQEDCIISRESILPNQEYFICKNNHCIEKENMYDFFNLKKSLYCCYCNESIIDLFINKN